MGALAQETGVDEVTDEECRGACNVFGFAPSRALRELLDTAIAQAVIAEREACARLCDEPTGRSYEFDMGRLHSAQAIRKRGLA